MAISLNGSSQYVSRTSTPVTGAPLTISCWVNAASAATTQCLVTLGADANTYFLVGLSSGLNKWYIAARNAGTEYYVASTTAPAIGTWVNVIGVFASATSRTIYVNGSNEGSNTTSVTPASISKLGIGVRVDGAIPAVTPSYLNGSISEIGIWGAALSQDEITSLSKAFCPKLVRPQDLEIYAPLLNDTNAVIDEAGAVLTVIGPPTNAAHPRIYA